jgi:decaprenyl-phosphate phosphoribosyltransferase
LLSTILIYSKLFRVHQWVKNFFIFLPLFFGGKLFDSELSLQAFHAFVGFCLVVSAIYIWNDYNDRANDALHPTKQFRPIASGAISVKTALGLMPVLLVLGFAYLWLNGANYTLLAQVAFYVLLNIAYSMYLKNIAILDVCILSVGFVLRLFIGSSATGVPLSLWIIVITFLLVLFVGFAKRRDDIVLKQTDGIVARASLSGYNLEFLNASIITSGAIVVVAYIMYTTSAEVISRTASNIYLTAFWVIMGVFRYLQLIFVKGQGGNPTKVFLTDLFIQLIFAAWLLSFGLILYAK